MKKSRIFLASATAILAVAAVFATKANKKFFNAVSTAYVQGNSGWYVAAASGLLTTRSFLPQLQVAIFYTNSGLFEKKVQGDLVTGTNVVQLYYNSNF